MTLALALGLNLWVVAVALPLALALHARAVAHGAAALVLVSLAPLGALALGLKQRPGAGQAATLLVAVPALMALPEALAPADVAAHVLPAAAFVLAALSLVAYLGAVAAGQARAERQAEATPSTARRLVQDPIPSRWRRRIRVYRGLTAASVAIPVVLLVSIDLSSGFAATLEASFGAQAARAQALFTVGVALLWVVILRAYVLAPLHGHLQHDRDLLGAMEADRRHARRGRPRAAFYVAVVVALAAMAAVVWQRAR